MTEQTIRRILVIDGGGIKGVFPASFLASIEDTIEDKISHYFDLIVGTSTGGIISLALGIGLSAQEILEFYETLGVEVFKGNKLLNIFRQIGFSKYNQKTLRIALESKFGNRRLGESKKRLMIPSVNLENGEIYIYKTSHHPRLQRDYKQTIVEVALATSAAPSYFPTQVNSSGTPLVDGGLFANNPTGLAVVEAIGMLNWERDSLRILSLGCTTEPLNIAKGRKYPLGLGYWGFKVVSVFMTAQSSVSLGMAQLLAGHENVIRINPIMPPSRFGIDTIQEIQSLKGLGDSEARKALPKLQKVFFNNQKVEDFEPYCKLS